MVGNKMRLQTVNSSPGVSRENRLSDEGLSRLQKQLSLGSRMTDKVLAQWIRRYGDAARDLIREHNRYIGAFDEIGPQ